MKICVICIDLHRISLIHTGLCLIIGANACKSYVNSCEFLHLADSIILWITLQLEMLINLKNYTQTCLVFLSSGLSSKLQTKVPWNMQAINWLDRPIYQLWNKCTNKLRMLDNVRNQFERHVLANHHSQAFAVSFQITNGWLKKFAAGIAHLLKILWPVTV